MNTRRMITPLRYTHVTLASLVTIVSNLGCSEDNPASETPACTDDATSATSATGTSSPTTSAFASSTNTTGGGGVAPASDGSTATTTAGTTSAPAPTPGVLKVCERPESAAYDPTTEAWYVSCQLKSDVAGDGLIVQINRDATEVVTPDLIVGLDEPKGIAISGDLLFVSNVKELVVANISSGEIVTRTTVVGISPDVPEAPFLNDVALDPETNEVYVSDNRNNLIFRFDAEGKNPVVFAKGLDLEAPNGLLVDRRDEANPRLLVAGMGPGPNAMLGVTDKLGLVYALALSTDVPVEVDAGVATDAGAIADAGAFATDASLDAAISTPVPDSGAVAPAVVVGYLSPRIGNLDGMAIDGDSLIVTDFFAGRVLRVTPSTGTPVFNEGDALIVKQSLQRAADVGIDTERRTALVPETNNGAVVLLDLTAR